MDQMMPHGQGEIILIGKHINNCFREGELNEELVCANFAHTTPHGAIEGKVQVHPVTFYNLDVIISVGYRVKSVNGTKFRQWATGVLKSYILNGAAINQRLHFVKEEIDSKLLRHEQQLSALQSKVDFLVNTNTPPVQGIFFDGQIFDAYRFVSDLIRKAQTTASCSSMMRFTISEHRSKTWVRNGSLSPRWKTSTLTKSFKR